MSITTGPDNKINSNYNISGVVTDALQLYYDPARFYSYPSNGPVMKDLSGNGRDLTMYTYPGSTYSNNPPQGFPFTTVKGGEFTLDGLNDFGKTPSTFNLGTTFTVSAWVKLTAGGDNAILGHCNGGPSGAGFVISNGFLRMWYYTAPWQIIDSTSGGINNGNWHYCVWSVAGTNIKMYIDNNMVDDTTLVGTINPPLNSIGSLWGPCNSDSYGPGSDGPNSNYNGQIGVVMCHSKRLSDTEIELHWEIFKKRYDI